MPGSCRAPDPHRVPRTGKLVVLEGIDGSGKTTLARRLVEELAARGYDVVATREPTDGLHGRRLRGLSREARAAMTPADELALFVEDRRAHVRDVVRPALARGALVIQDRSYFSTVAYQGERGLDRGYILEQNRAVAITPDALIVVDVPVDVALARIARDRRSGADAFEERAALDRIRRMFLDFECAVVLDGRRTPHALEAEALGVLDRALDVAFDPLDTVPSGAPVW